MQVGMWFGYVTFGFISDAVGRKRTYVGVSADGGGADAGVPGHARPHGCCWCSGPFVAFFGTGYFTGFGAVTAEIYPTEIRATAQGLTYNIGRIGSAIAPWAVGRLADTHGFGAAFSLAAVAFVCAAADVDLDSGDQGQGAHLGAGDWALYFRPLLYCASTKTSLSAFWVLTSIVSGFSFPVGSLVQ